MPLLGKFAQARSIDHGALPQTSRAVWTPHFHIVTVTIADGPMSLPKSFRVSDEHGEHEFEPTRMNTVRGRTELTGAIYRCLDSDTCTIGCPVTLYQERVLWRDGSENSNDLFPSASS